VRLEEGEPLAVERSDDLAVVARAFEGGPAAVELIGTPRDVPDRPLVALRSRARRDSVSDPTDAFIAWFSAVSGVPFCTDRWPASSAWACSIPTAKDSPCAADGRMLIVVMPITSPLRVMSGPPLLPGLIAASVCTSVSASTFLTALTMPRVTVFCSPSGAPSAITS
jgi:hypothetical protein